MCIIVDTDRMAIFLSKPDNEDVAPIHKWLNSKLGVLVFSTGGGFANEVKKKARRLLQEHVRAGNAKLIPSNEFREDEQSLQGNSAVKSKDYHILALARASNARILFTGDNKLVKDFKNKDLIDKPRGKIYSGKKNENELLKNWRCSSKF